MENLRKCKALTTAVREDMMRGLPDGVVLMILSHLTMKEAVRTSVLSRSWKDLWKGYSGCLDFDAPNLIRLVDDHELVRHYASCRYTVWVDKVLDSHQSQTIEGLRIAFDLNEYFSPSIDRWIDFAISGKVKSLVLDLSPFFRPHGECYYRFPAWLLHFPAGFRPFDRLTCLELRYVNVPEEVILYIFGNCHMLQRISLKRIPFLENLRIDSSLPWLKHLEISNCPVLKNVYVSAKRLTSFESDSGFNYQPHVDFADVPELEKLTVGGKDYRNVLGSLPFSFSQLKSVALKDNAPVCLDEKLSTNLCQRFQQLENLKLNLHGFLGCNILCLDSFLHVSTCLKKLVLQLKWNFPRASPPDKLRFVCNNGYRHTRLKELVYVGWLGLDAEVEIVSHLIESAMPDTLERITIHLCHSHNQKYVVKLQTSWEKEYAKSRAMQLQEKLVSSRAKLVII